MEAVSARPPSIASTDPVTGQHVELLFSERAAPAHKDAEEVFAYWRSRSAQGDFVMGRDIPARPIARLMRNLVVLEPAADGKNFRFRLAGSQIGERLGRDITGMSVSDVYDETAADTFIAFLNVVIGENRPVFLDLHVRGLLGDVRRPEIVLLPMKAPNGTAKLVLGGSFY
jgi:hypothetical protein